jgi:hypothetical protein
MAITGGAAAYQADVAAFSKAEFERVLTRAQRIARGETRDSWLSCWLVSSEPPSMARIRRRLAN